MKAKTLSILFLAVPLFAATYQVEPKSSKLAWVGKKVTGQHNGVLDVKSGQLQFEGDTLKGGEFIVDMRSIKVLDVTDPKNNAKLTNHLKSDDFFSSDKFSEAKFTIAKVTSQPDGNVQVEGPLVLKGISKPIKASLKVQKKGKTALAMGKAVLDRTLWNVRYGSGKFFENLGDKLIYDEFDVQISIHAKEK